MSLHYLERAAAGRPQALLVLLHGVGANERSLAGLAAQQDPRVQVVLARGPLTFAPQAHGWFQVRFGPQGPVIAPDQAEASRRQLLDFLAQQQARLGLAPARTVVAGFSQGGIMSASVALTAPQAVAGFGILSGRILPEIEPLIPADVGRHGLSGLVLHGRGDSKLPYALAEQAAARLQRHGVAHALHGYDADHELTAPMQADFQAWLMRVLALDPVA